MTPVTKSGVRFVTVLQCSLKIILAFTIIGSLKQEHNVQINEVNTSSALCREVKVIKSIKTKTITRYWEINYEILG